jgi:outer membrane protein assembly factor BamB
VDTSPLIINGTIYFVTQAMQVFALNAANGNVLWTTVLPVLPNSTAGRGIQGGISLHLHDGNEQFTTSLFNHTPAFWVSAADQRVYALNALTGKIILNFTDFTGCVQIAGNNPGCVEGATATNLLVDEQRGIVITSVLSGSSAATGRCFYRGWNINVNPPSLMWTAFCTPPQPGSNIPVDPNWEINQVNSMKGAEIFRGYGRDNPGGYGGPNGAVDLKALSPSQLNATLYNDWGYLNQSPACAAATGGGSTGSTAAGWGSPWILGSGPSKGLAFVNTNNRDPYTNNCMPGPNLWSAAILALNETNGQWVWGFQANAHEMWDYDCSWWQAMGNETVNGVNTQVIWKTCKAGYMFELNAQTGAMIWSFTTPTSLVPRCHFCYMVDPLNKTEMSWQFFNPSLQPTIMFPSTFAYESESAYSPTLNLIYAVADNIAQLEYYVPMNSTNYKTNAGNAAFPVPGQPNRYANSNATVEAVNAATGQMAWSHYLPNQGIRGGMTVSGNILFLTFSSGDLLMLNAATGVVVKDLFIGGPLNVLTSVGATSSGTMEVIVPITAGSVSWATGVPGDIVALTLQNVPPATTNTITTTATISGAGPTVTISGSVTTVTSGVETTTAYGIAAVAVIFIIATGYLVMARRRPGA